MYCHIHHCHYHHCHCVPKDSKEKGGALTQEELLALTEEMKDELKDYTVDLKDQIFKYIDIGVNPVEIANTFASLIEQDTYILRTLTNKIDDLNNTTNLSMYNLRTRVTNLEGQSATILQDLSDRTQRINELETNTQVVESIAALSTIENPIDGLLVYVKSYHAGLGKGGGYFTYDSSKSSLNDGGMNFSGWVRNIQEPINVNYFGAVGDGITNDAPAFQKAVSYLASIGGGVVTSSGVFKFDTSVKIRSNNITIDGQGSSTIINGFGQSFIDAGNPRDYRGTADSLFHIMGSISSTERSALTKEVLRGDRSLSVADTSLFSRGDIVFTTSSLHNYNTNFSIVKEITSTTLILDRPCVHPSSSGGSVLKALPIINSHIKGFEIDFNGTEAVPRYGYGVYIYMGFKCSVSNINSQYVGSKVVEVNRSLDCIIKDCSSFYGIDVADTGGHSYGVRLGQCNDIIVQNFRGHRLRHTVDISAANRCYVKDCISFEDYGAAFSTHRNHCVLNIFENNTVFTAGAGAFAIGEHAGDIDNSILGGYVYNSEVIYSARNLNKTLIKDVVIENHSKYILDLRGENTLQDCTIISSSACIAGSYPCRTSFVNCNFILKAYRALGQFTSNNECHYIFRGCDFKIDSDLSIFESVENLNGHIYLHNCTLESVPVRSSGHFGQFKTTEAINNTFKFIGDENTRGYGFLCVGNGGTLTMDGNTFINSNYIYRPYGTDKTVQWGENTLINSEWPVAGSTYHKVLDGKIPCISSSSGKLNGIMISSGTFLIKNPSAIGFTHTHYNISKGKWTYLNQIPASGSTEERPTNPVQAGYAYFDTDLGEVVTWDGSEWVEGYTPQGITQVTTTELEDASNEVNTANKSVGIEVFSTSNLLKYYATGDTPTSTWKSVDGSDEITPV